MAAKAFFSTGTGSRWAQAAPSGATKTLTMPTSNKAGK
jgi:hypothetical protein